MVNLQNHISFLLALLPLAQCHWDSQVWSGWGGNIFNNRWVAESGVSKANIDSLTRHCHIQFPGGVSAAPAIHKGIAYFPTWNGTVVAYDYSACTVVWQTNLTAYLNQYSALDPFQASIPFRGSRTSPQIDGETLFLGTQLHALLLALDLDSGAIIGNTQVNTHPLSVITMSPTLYRGKIFVGSSSDEESAASQPNYPCCSFVGNFAAFTFDCGTGEFSTVWNQTMLPEPYGVGQWSGAATWGSQPAIDIERNQVFVATGNVYAIPASVQACINATGNDNETACYSPHVWQEAVLAFDIDDGHLNWVQRLSALDAWTLACGLYPIIPAQATCPPNPGPDADFGMAPSFVPARIASTPHGRDVIVVGQKSGNLYAFDAANGTIYWTTLTSPDGGTVGALIWGVAVDSSHVYFTAVNGGLATWTLQPSGVNISNSAYGAVDLASGTIIWQVAVPQNSTTYAPPSVANDLVLVGRGGFQGIAPPATGAIGSVDFLDKATGNVLQSVDADNVVYGGVAVQGNFVMFGAGYVRITTNGSFNVYKVLSGGHGGHWSG